MDIDHKTGTKPLTARYLLEGAALYAAYGLFKMLGLKRGSAFGGLIGRTIGPHVGRTKKARRQLAAAMPGLSEPEQDAILTEMWDNVGRTIAEYAHLEKYRADVLNNRQDLIRFDGRDDVYETVEHHRPVFFVAAHMANWEIQPIAIAPFYDDVGELVRPANNPIANRLIYTIRKRHVAAHPIPKGRKGARPLMKHIRTHGLLAMLVDQKANDGIEMELLGLNAMTPVGPAVLALRNKARIVPVMNRRIDGHKFQMRLLDEVPVESTGDFEADVARITQMLNDRITQMVRANPGQWLWLHNRFKGV